MIYGRGIIGSVGKAEARVCLPGQDPFSVLTFDTDETSGDQKAKGLDEETGKGVDIELPEILAEADVQRMTRQDLIKALRKSEARLKEQ